MSIFISYFDYEFFWKFCAIFRSNWSLFDIKTLVRFFRFFLGLLKVHFGPFEVLTCTFCWVWKNCLVNKDRLNCAKKTNNGSKVRTIWNSSVIITFSLLPTNRLLPFIDLFFSAASASLSTRTTYEQTLYCVSDSHKKPQTIITTTHGPQL